MASPNLATQQMLDDLKRRMLRAQLKADDNEIVGLIGVIGGLIQSAVDLRNNLAIAHYGDWEAMRYNIVIEPADQASPDQLTESPQPAPFHPD